MKSKIAMKIAVKLIAICLCFPLVSIGEVYDSWHPTVVTNTRLGVTSEINVKEYVTTNVFIFSCGGDRQLVSQKKTKGEVKIWILDDDLLFSVSQGGFMVPTKYRSMNPGSFSGPSNMGLSNTPMHTTFSGPSYPYELYLSKKHTVDKKGYIIPESIFESEGGANLSFGQNCYSKFIEYVLETSIDYAYCALFIRGDCYLFRIKMETLRTKE